MLRADGNRIIIQATDDELLVIAVSRFLGENRTVPAENFYIREDVSADISKGWGLKGIPMYPGGVFARNVYDAGYGIKHSSDVSVSSKMQLISKTNAAEFDGYLSLLEQKGYTKKFENSTATLRTYEYKLGALRLYVYFESAAKQAKVIWDKGSTDGIEQFSYTYTPKPDDTSVLYGYGIYMSVDGLSVNNCGMLQVIKLADNSLFVIDGAIGAQFDTAAINGFMDFCREITGTPKGEKVRISCWFITHNHSDHHGGMYRILQAHSSQISLERMAANLLPHGLDTASSLGIKPLLDFVNFSYPECRFLKLHTGMKFDIANLQTEVLFTHEDLVSASGVSTVSDKNDASTVLRLTMEGVKYLVTGDIAKKAEGIIIQNYTKSELKSDIVQVSHHTWNMLDYLYDYAQAKYAIFPQSYGGAHRTFGINALVVTKKVQLYAAPENCFYSGSKTTGLLLKSGTVSVHDERNIIYDSPDYIWGSVY